VLGTGIFKVNEAKQEATDTVNSQDQTIASYSAASKSLEDANDQLSQSVVILESQLAATSPAVPSKTAETAASPTAGLPNGVTVRHEGRITLATSNYSGADLDAPKTDPQWGPGGSAEISYYSSKFTLQSAIGALVLGDTVADYATCRDTTGYGQRPNLESGVFQPGAYLCIKTSDGRFSAMHLTAIDPDQATFDVITYDPPYRG
jgi:hypothetical protein